MATKTELRDLARARLKEAQILFDTKRYDTATYLCGYAVELALKARICQTLRYTHFPQTNKEFLQMTCEIVEKSLKSKRFQNLYSINPNDFCALYERYFQNPRFLKVHDLETLLKFSGVLDKIKNHFLSQWSSVEKWNPEIRYKPIGSHTRQMTQDMLTSTRVLMDCTKIRGLFFMNDFMKKFSSIEQTIVQEKGQFKLFALLERKTVFDTWDVIMASKGLPDNEMSVLKYVVKKIQAVLTTKEMIKIGAVILLDVNDPFVTEVQNFLTKHHNPTEFSNSEINGLEISRGYIITSPIPQTEPVSPSSKELLTQAAKWIRKAATAGDREAQHTLGLMYLKGEGVKKNMNFAKKWFKKAATLGHAQAQQNFTSFATKNLMAKNHL